ncbi:hypothetical protein [Parasitella parasitica]|uniref:Uncharacterized protein n=1 Tax=Parasitella parasitica TaxID=35722 RepID=A0A0B7MV01_9FUNG|nr:hypothetical protein [Parasitella parasitica]
MHIIPTSNVVYQNLDYIHNNIFSLSYGASIVSEVELTDMAKLNIDADIGMDDQKATSGTPQISSGTANPGV